MVGSSNASSTVDRPLHFGGRSVGHLADDLLGRRVDVVEGLARIGIDQDRIGLYGLSAGGGLAAALALLARDRGEVPLAFVLLDCPMLRCV